jgi:hypothetical protein
MNNPGSAWAVILSNPELREGLIREAARHNRSDGVASSIPRLRRWLGVVVRALANGDLAPAIGAGRRLALVLGPAAIRRPTCDANW